jgi:CMP-N,N'-diacetyllegionaminic acid synthase
MIGGKRVLVIVPARRGSKGLPLKNIKPLAGKPLLAWPVLAGRGSKYVDEVIVSTDDQEFADIAAAHGASVPFLRPEALASDTAPSIDFILHAIDRLAAAGDVYDLIVLLEPTSPLTESSDVDAALEKLIASDADAMVGVTAMIVNHPAYAVTMADNGKIAPWGSASFDAMPRRQDLAPVFVLDGSLYISTAAALRDHRTFCHARTLGFETARHKAFEVDDLVDFFCIEAVLRNLDEIRRDADRHA